MGFFNQETTFKQSVWHPEHGYVHPDNIRHTLCSAKTFSCTQCTHEHPSDCRDDAGWKWARLLTRGSCHEGDTRPSFPPHPRPEEYLSLSIGQVQNSPALTSNLYTIAKSIPGKTYQPLRTLQYRAARLYLIL